MSETGETAAPRRKLRLIMWQRIEARDRGEDRIGEIAGVEKFPAGLSVAPDLHAGAALDLRAVQLVDGSGGKM